MNLEQLDHPLLAAGEAMPADLWTVLGVTAHPVAPLPDAAWLAARTLAELLEFINEREETIRRMAADPFRYGYEPFIWRILDAICGFPWEDPTETEIAEQPEAAKRAAMRAQKAWCVKVRQTLLKQAERVSVLLINGGNRGGKSEWAARSVMKLINWRKGRRAWCLHENASMSRDYQQPLLYKYLPAELRTEKGIRRNPTYIAYKQQTGFSEEKFVLPNASDCVFKYYEQDRKSVEGGELDVIWCDELVPSSWINTLKARIATRGGWLIITFTPVDGYTATVKMFLDVAQVTRRTTAFVLPKDGGDPLLEQAIAGEDPRAWIGEAVTRAGLDPVTGQAPIPAGRQFETVPRVMRGSDRRSAVFFIHSFDNPFGNPRELWALYAAANTDAKKMRFYGEATKATAGRFPKFNPIVHVVRRDQVPTVGTRYMIMDPCSGRNWAMGWALCDRSPLGKRLWIYREWPCPGKYVPGEGDMGDWAEPGDKLDGDRGPAQKPRGWGLLRYRQEIHRLEGRKDWDSEEKEPDAPLQWDKDDEPEYVSPKRRAKQAQGAEDIYERIMDSRYAAAPTQTREGQTTLLEECDKIGLEFRPASGREIQEGIDLINDFLDYDEDKPLSTLNAPRLFVCEDCANFIFALQNWTGEDGLHGACKDFIDLIRYLVLADPEDWTGGTGGHDEAARNRTRPKQLSHP